MSRNILKSDDNIEIIDQLDTSMYNVTEEMVEFAGYYGYVGDKVDGGYVVSADDFTNVWSRDLLKLTPDLRETHEVYSGQELIGLAKEGILKDGDKYSQLNHNGETCGEYEIGSTREPTVRDLIKKDFVILDNRKYVGLSLALKNMIELERGCRNKNWEDDVFINSFEFILRHAMENKITIDEEVWEIDYERTPQSKYVMK